MPKCEICNDKIATHFSACIVDGKYDWKFISCDCERKDFEYPIPIDDFFSTPESTLDWFGQMNEKEGMNWNSFIEMLCRYNQRVKGEDDFLENMLKNPSR